MSSTPSFIITEAGLDAALLANDKGFKVEITKFALGSAFGYDPTSADHKLKGNILYSASPSNYRYKDKHTVMITCVVPASAGPFEFGEIGLYMSDGTLFALASWDSLITKYSFLESEISSTMTFYCYLTIAQGAVTITVDLGEDNIYRSLVEIEDVQTWREVIAPKNREHDVRELIVHESSPTGDSTLLTCTDDNTWSVASTYHLEFSNLEIVTSNTDYIEVACGVPGVDLCKYHASDVSGLYLMAFADGSFEAFKKAQYITSTNRLRLFYKSPVDVAKDLTNGNNLYVANGFNSVLTLESLKEGIEWADIKNKPTTFEGYGLENPSSEIGMIGFCASWNIPAGKLICDGRAVSRKEYAKLFAAIGTTYGEGDGVSTFAIPKVGGYFPRFVDNGAGIDTGRTVGSTQQDAAPNIWGSGLYAEAYGKNLDNQSTGCVYTDYARGGHWLGSKSTDWDNYVQAIDASRCSNVYGRADELRPKNMAFVGVITYA